MPQKDFQNEQSGSKCIKIVTSVGKTKLLSCIRWAPITCLCLSVAWIVQHSSRFVAYSSRVNNKTGYVQFRCSKLSKLRRNQERTKQENVNGRWTYTSSFFRKYAKTRRLKVSCIFCYQVGQLMTRKHKLRFARNLNQKIRYKPTGKASNRLFFAEPKMLKFESLKASNNWVLF